MAFKKKNLNKEKFWSKVTRFAKKAGANVIYAALILYYTFQKPDLPKKTKTTIIGAITYFILPIDFIPDILVGIGFTDDLVALGYAISQVLAHIDDSVKSQAKEKLSTWFPKQTDTLEIDKKFENKLGNNGNIVSKRILNKEINDKVLTLNVFVTTEENIAKQLELEKIESE